MTKKSRQKELSKLIKDAESKDLIVKASEAIDNQSDESYGQKFLDALFDQMVERIKD